jgi:hypothetical protein
VNNRWYENMLVGNAAYVPPQPGYEWLETQVLTGTQATVSFSNLNSNYGSTYQHLQIRATGRTTRGGFLSDVLKLEFNTDTTSGNYKYHQLFGNGSTLTSANNPYFSFATAADGSTNLFGAIILDILDPFETTKNKTVRSLAGHTSGSDQTIEVGSMAWFSTAAVTSIQLKSWTGNSWVSGTRFSLYGMRS